MTVLERALRRNFLAGSPKRGRAESRKSTMIRQGVAATRDANSQVAVATSMDEPARSSPQTGPPRMRLVSGALAPGAEPSVDSYRRLADVFHDLLSEQSLDSLLVRIADTLDEIVPYEALHLYEADVPNRELAPALARGEYADETLSERFPFGEGITGWAGRAPPARAREPGSPRPPRAPRRRDSA